MEQESTQELAQQSSQEAAQQPARVATAPVMILTGTYECTLDSKNRLSIPAAFRAGFKDSPLKCVFSLQGDSIWIFTQEGYDRWYASFFPEVTDPQDDYYDKLSRRLTRYAYGVELDSAGRIVLDQKLRHLAKLDHEVTITGNRDHIEIYDRAVATAAEEDLLAMDFMHPSRRD